MYNDIKLEKGLYNLSGKSFSQALTCLDPDENYAGTELSGLDSFERQLKRFDIKVNGENADTVEKFFLSTESAVLFPEFVKRAVEKGVNSNSIKEIVAAYTKSPTADYRGFDISAAAPYSTNTNEAAALPETSITLSENISALKKFGRTIVTSYEVIRCQRLDLFAVALRYIGSQLSSAMVQSAVAALIAGVTPTVMDGAVFNYAELVNFWGGFGDLNVSTLLVSPKTMATIMGFEQMKNSYSDFMTLGTVKTPFGATLVKSSFVSDNLIIGLDNSCALEMVTASDLIIEAEKLMGRQVDSTNVSLTAGFAKIVPSAVKTLTIA